MRHGRPVAVVLAVEDYARLQLETGVRPSFVEQLLTMPQGGQDDEEPFDRLKIKPRAPAF